MAKRALPALEEMVEKTSARYVFLSYNSEGIMGKDEILQAMERFGKVDLLTRDYPRFRADIDRGNRIYKSDRVEEYLFCLRKGERRGEGRRETGEVKGERRGEVKGGETGEGRRETGDGRGKKQPQS